MRGSGVQDGVPSFIRDEAALLRAEWVFLREAGQAAGAARRAAPERLAERLAGALADEALASLELEGRLVGRPAVEARIRARLGLALREGGEKEEERGRRGTPAETLCCVADLLTGVLRDDPPPLTAARIRETGVLLGGRDNIPRLSADGPAGGLRRELDSFSRWFSSPDRAGEGALAAAGLAHLWFESIQPYAFGTGILGRALAERALFRTHPGMPFIPLAPVFLRHRNAYYAALDRACRDGDATEWLRWFGDAAIEAARGEKTGLRALPG